MSLKDEAPDWERVLSAAARLQRLVPSAVLVGGTAAAIHAHHRLSRDADHVVDDLRDRFDAVLEDLEQVAGWQTARQRRPVMILGSLDGIETGIRQLIRTAPLETTTIKQESASIVVPTPAETLRIKAILILRRNATRDYLDFAALADQLGPQATIQALTPLDELYPQPQRESAIQQLQTQLANPLPYDLDDAKLAEYRNLAARWQRWPAVAEVCAATAVSLLEAASAPSPVPSAE